MDAIVRFLLPVTLGQRQITQGRCKFTQHSGCGNEKQLYNAAETDTKMCNSTHLYTTTCRHMQSISADTHTDCKDGVRIPRRFDLLAAVMSLVVKLLFSFNIVYRRRHLLEGTVICLCLTCTVFPISTYQHQFLCCRASISIYRYLMPKSINLFWRFGHFHISADAF